jgi:hypothetical protein
MKYKVLTKNHEAMTRCTFPVVLLLAIPFAPVQAQMALGLRGGANWANVAFTPDERLADQSVTGARVLPAFAMLAELPLGERFSLAPELGYTERGYRWLPAGPWATGTRYGFKYIDLNVLGIFRLARKLARPHVTAGLSFGQLIGAEQLSEDKDGKVTERTDLELDLIRFQRSQLSALVGAGFTFTAGRSLMALELRYAYGFTDVWNGFLLVDVNGSTIRRLRTYERSFSLHLSWRLPLKRRTVAE